MDRLTEYLEARPEGASAEEIAREALGLKGAVGPVAQQVVRAAAEADARIAEVGEGRWAIREAPVERGLRTTPYAVLHVGRPDDGSLTVTVTRVTFKGADEVTSFTLGTERNGAATASVQALRDLLEGTVPAAYRFAGARDAVNRATRFLAGREGVGAGLCLARLARRAFPRRPIRNCIDIADALGLSYVDGADPVSAVRAQGELLLGLLERFEARDVDTIEALGEDLQPTVTAVDFEAFAFDEAYLDDLPAGPGVYVMRDADGQVIYVGKSIHLRDRVKTYFAKRSEREEKTLKILERIWTVEVETVGSELEALILEARLIQATRPEFNKQVDVHERGSGETGRGPFLLVLPSADPDSVELFCVRPDRPIARTRVRKDLADAAEAWSWVDGFFDGETVEIDDVERAGHHILDGWMTRNGPKVNMIGVDDAGDRENLRRLVEGHVRAADDDGWEKVWRV